jgi:tetratricopeptide (TPR) repeat protein
MSRSRTDWTPAEARALAVILLVALVLRLLHWHSMAPYPWFDFLGLDSKYYDEWAQRILAEGLQGKNPYFMGPLYPHLLAGIYAIFGRNLDVVRGLQIVLSTATVGLIHLLARQYGGRRLALVASALAALYGPLIYYSVSILYPTLTVFLAAGILWLLHESARRRSRALVFVGGMIVGIYALGRGNILLFAPFALVWLLAAWGRPLSPRIAGWRAGVPAALLFAAGTILAISPATIHNARTGDPAFLTTNAGLNLYIGNGPMASGGHENPVLHWPRPDGSVEEIVADLHKDVECRTEAEHALRRKLTYTEVSDFWLAQTLRFVREEPRAFLGKLVRKVYLFWSTYEIPQIEHFGYFRQFSLPLRGPVLSFGILGPLAVVGMAISLRRARHWALLYVFIAAYSTSIILFFVLARYRLPILPALILFAAHACLEIVAAVRARRWRFLAGATAGAVAVGLFMSANLYGIDESKGIAQIIYRHGIVADARGDYDAAIAHYEEALRLKPGYDRCHLNLGVDLARVGRREEAMQHLLAAEELNPAYYRAPFNRGILLEELGRPEEAEAAYRRSVELEPRYLLGRSALAEMMLLRDDLEGAEREFRRVLEYEGSWEGEHHELARNRARHYLQYLDYRRHLALTGRGKCFAASPELRRAELARLRGRQEEALAHFREYFEGGGACAEAYQALGQLLLESNEWAGAEDAFQRALAVDPGFPGAREALDFLATRREGSGP